MQTSRRLGMVTLNDALIELVDAGQVEPKEAYMKATDKIGLRPGAAVARARDVVRRWRESRRRIHRSPRTASPRKAACPEPDYATKR